MAAAMARVVVRQYHLFKSASVVCQVGPIWQNSHAGYAVKKPPGKTLAHVGADPKKHYEDIETDTKKLTTMLCGGNIMKEGTDPELKDDSEYPDWLWTLHTDRRPVPIEEIDHDTYAYWRRLRKAELTRKRQIMKIRHKWKVF